MASHWLLFGRSPKSRFPGIDMDIVRDYQARWGHQWYGAHRFPIYGPRFEYIQRKMETWRPHRFSDLLIPPYKDPGTYYLMIFAIIISILALVVAIVLGALAVRNSNSSQTGGQTGLASQLLNRQENGPFLAL